MNLQMMIQQLQDWMRSMSVNQLQGITPNQIKEQLDIQDDELTILLQYLDKNRMIRYRWRFLCPSCGAECVEDERVIKKNVFLCATCTEKINIDYIHQKGNVEYSMRKSDIIDIGRNQKKIDFTKTVDIYSLLENNDTKRRDDIMSKKTKVFLGSSKESEELMEQTAAMLAGLGCETRPWNSTANPVFIPSQSGIDSLYSCAEKVDKAIFIFAEDDKTWYRNGLSGSVRDNVLFEYGLFMGRLGIKEVAFATKGNPRIATDLAGITYINADADESVIKQQLKGWLAL